MYAVRWRDIHVLVCAATVAVLAAACGELVLENPTATDAAAPPDAAPLPDAAPVADAAPPDAAACVEGDLRTVDPETGHCYMYFETLQTWLAAEEACSSLGAHLATITRPEELVLLATLGPASVADIWLGGTDLAVEGAWTWITDEPMMYTNWRNGEPNNGETNGGTIGEDCMVMEIDLSATWDDRSCEKSFSYFCERP